MDRQTDRRTDALRASYFILDVSVCLSVCLSIDVGNTVIIMIINKLSFIGQQIGLLPCSTGAFMTMWVNTPYSMNYLYIHM